MMRDNRCTGPGEQWMVIACVWIARVDESTEYGGYENNEEVAKWSRSTLLGKLKCSTTRPAGTDGQ